ncbi:LysM peptidoglycan-binding domain-containing M23 family metallopeptidase [Paenibacillus piri]|uniref:LysM peptidoglycan-binding domain-containing protein n=1 Tax=Paenibacillus piri TaxID=2547395 RepID=A0A4R5KWI8_9BACL|nr:M23 family metallopeptidase [Paenibacillus piri]TDF99397.1 LysM peptidoglycan-binding domain-containing protein [Paenibacillus piri]
MEHTTVWKLDNKWIVSCGSLAVVAMLLSIFYVYILHHTVTRYRVIAGTEAIGTVSNPSVIRDWLAQKRVAVKSQYPTVQADVEVAELQFLEEREYKAVYDNAGAIAQLEKRTKLRTKGMQIRIDGKPLGLVKDEAAAQSFLNMAKERLIKSSGKGKVRILTAPGKAGNDMSGAASGEAAILGAAVEAASQAAPETVSPLGVFESVQFLQQVELAPVEAKPEDISDSEAMMNRIETGDVQPLTYKVAAGDCVSCIAYKFKISKQVIYDNNPWIQNNLIRVGDVLDLTVLQPLLAVKTVEKRIETFEVPYETNYVEDAEMKAGLKETLVPGETGKKEVTYLTTRINGDFKEETAAAETVIIPSVPALVKKGTKVIPGVGTGTFAWPVYNAKLTSEFGRRWGSFHPGTDMVSDNKSIMAADHGKIAFAGWKTGYGNCIVIDHQNGYSTLYGHLSKIQASEGESVQKGERIGTMGTTGNSTGVHLHFEVRKGDNQQNPLQYLGRLP